ncbi:hypothetical protein ACP275_04G166900 [Erythranthe tilingii]
MAFKNTVLSSILTTLFFPNKATILHTKPSTSPPPPAAAAEVADCAVCLSALNGEIKTGTRVLTCRHEFHSKCMERWLAVPHYKNTCPICRVSIIEEEDEEENEDCTTSTRGGDCDQPWKRDEWFTDEMVIWFSSFHVAGF